MLPSGGGMVIVSVGIGRDVVNAVMVWVMVVFVPDTVTVVSAAQATAVNAIIDNITIKIIETDIVLKFIY